MSESGRAGAVVESARGGIMKTLAFVFILMSASVAFANDKREWKEAKVARIASSVEDNGTVAGTVGTTVIAGRIQTSSLYYWLETEDVTYIVAVTYTPMRARFSQPNGGHPLNVTLYGKTKISMDGSNAHILDDAGKDVKVPVVEKIARTQPPAENPAK
jgi:hypothetical protein